LKHAHSSNINSQYHHTRYLRSQGLINTACAQLVGKQQQVARHGTLRLWRTRRIMMHDASDRHDTSIWKVACGGPRADVVLIGHPFVSKKALWTRCRSLRFDMQPNTQIRLRAAETSRWATFASSTHRHKNWPAQTTKRPWRNSALERRPGGAFAHNLNRLGDTRLNHDLPKQSHARQLCCAAKPSRRLSERHTGAL
jgi:hypothetical protein